MTVPTPELGYDLHIPYSPDEVLHSLAAQAVYNVAQFLLADEPEVEQYSMPRYREKLFELDDDSVEVSLLNAGDTAIVIRGVPGAQAGEYRGILAISGPNRNVPRGEFGIFKVWGPREFKVPGAERTVLLEGDFLRWSSNPLADTEKAFRIAGLLAGQLSRQQQIDA